MTRNTLFVLICGTLIILFSLFSKFISLSSPVHNGKIVFVSDRDGNFEIYTMDSNGSSLQRLTTNTVNDSWPAWSPDGSKIAYVSAKHEGSFIDDIFVMDANGSNPFNLTNSSASVKHPAWSPDGTKIAFTNVTDFFESDIYIISSDGSNPINLTEGLSNARYIMPTWSPNGDQIIFMEAVELPVLDVMGDFAFHKVNITSPFENEVLEVSSYTESHPNWSSIHNSIVYYDLLDEIDTNYGLYFTDPYGTSRTHLNLPLGLSAVDPSWSPDGLQIVFTKFVDTQNIYTVNLDGTGLVNLTNSTSYRNIQPDWQPIVNQPPFVDAGPDQTITTTTITLDGSASYDPDGTIVTYSWSENGVEIATGVTPQVTLDIGTHTITLTVTDDDGATATDEVVITVEASSACSTTILASDTTALTKAITTANGAGLPQTICLLAQERHQSH